jgi:glycerol-1-phosphate dehydrogenase [NAD(P)+]
VGTLAATRAYEHLKAYRPDAARARAACEAFDPEAWNETLRGLLGEAAEQMILQEKTEKKYDPQGRELRFARLEENWDGILQIMKEELFDAAWLAEQLDRWGMPKELKDLGIANEELPLLFCATKDIRNKYVLSTMAWDLGILEELSEK